MEITPVPCLRDNYAYLLTCPGTGEALVVDASAAQPVQRLLDQRGLRLVGLLCTHHHWDHVGGLPQLVAAHPGVAVVAHASDRERISGVTHPVVDDDKVELGGMKLRVMHVPGHTRGSIAYHDDKAVFTGDTLFGCGCGRLFEGTALELYKSLQRLAALPAETLVYPGHEYTLSNLAFAVAMAPERVQLAERRKRVVERLEREGTSLPFSLAEELATNPFLDPARPDVWRRLGLSEGSSDDEVFAVLRRKKDGFVA